MYEVKEAYFDATEQRMISCEEIVEAWLRRKYEDKTKKSSRFTWCKSFEPFFVMMNNVTGSAKLMIITYLVLNMSQSNNEVTRTYLEISKEANVSPSVVNEVMVALQQYDFIRKVRNSTYMINPSFVYAGPEGKGIDLMVRFDALPKAKPRKPNERAAKRAGSVVTFDPENTLRSKLQKALKGDALND